MRAFITGDYHRNFTELKSFCKFLKTTTDDVLIVLGDVGANHFLDDELDPIAKKFLSKQPITYILLRGNHDARPSAVKNMKQVYNETFDCVFWHEEEYPNLWYIEYGEFKLGNKKCLAISGAYSVDKYYRLRNDLIWFEDEQPTEEEKTAILRLATGKEYDYVFTHTCPVDYEPIHLFLSVVDQEKVEKDTEVFLQKVYDSITFDKWYCGHYHSDETLRGGIELLYNEYKELEI